VNATARPAKPPPIVKTSCKRLSQRFMTSNDEVEPAFPRRLPNQNPMFSWLENSTVSKAYFPAD
jgi:hypothetical protein